MEGNLLLGQFSRYKKLELEASPFHFLLDANIELNPHQINAFCAAIQTLKTDSSTYFNTSPASYWLTRLDSERPLRPDLY